MTRRRVSTDLAERLLAGPVVWIGLVLLTAFALGPFIWMLLTSLKDRQELYATPLQYLPVHPTFANYVDAWTSPVTPFWRPDKTTTLSPLRIFAAITTPPARAR